MQNPASRLRPYLRKLIPSRLRHDTFVAITENRFAQRIALKIPGKARVSGGSFEIDVGSPDPVLRLTIWLGVHEAAERELVARNMVAKLPVVELGAGIGTVAYTAWRAAERPKMTLIEANPAVSAVLQRNMRANGVDATVVTAAIAYGVDSVEFESPAEYWMSGGVQIPDGDRDPTESDTVVVGATTLAEVVEGASLQGEALQLICDIEGAEWQLFENEAELLGSQVKMVVAELHAMHDESIEELIDEGRVHLEPLGFSLAESRGPVVAFVQRG